MTSPSQELPPLDAWVDQPWNSLNAVPKEQWLVHAVDQQDRQRLKTLGNIVIPAQASLAASILARLLKMD